MNNANYRLQQDQKHTLALRELLTQMPAFCEDFFRGIHDETLPLTRLNYARDLNIFFDFLLEFKPSLAGKRGATWTWRTWRTSPWTSLRSSWTTSPTTSGKNKSLMDREAAKERKLSALRSLFKYLFKKQRIPSNVAALVDMPKRHER